MGTDNNDNNVIIMGTDLFSPTSRQVAGVFQLPSNLSLQVLSRERRKLCYKIPPRCL